MGTRGKSISQSTVLRAAVALENGAAMIEHMTTMYKASPHVLELAKARGGAMLQAAEDLRKLANKRWIADREAAVSIPGVRAVAGKAMSGSR